MPVVEDGGAKLDNAGGYAFEKYSQESGAGWWMVGLVDIQAATKAIAAATEAQALSIDPHAVDSMLKKLTAMQDELNVASLASQQLGVLTPLGGGYAERVGQANKEIGTQVAGRFIPKLTQAIEDLKSEIEKCRVHYRHTDAAAEAAMDTQGRIQP
ncbi:hypothetical protein ACFYOT_26450 [Saccharothrix saharensis]|uniref:hypothetical protein n=1 Tax=Saccharothrix saharensis TaxID=571190 RepID=UPI00367E3FF4